MKKSLHFFLTIITFFILSNSISWASVTISNMNKNPSGVIQAGESITFTTIASSSAGDAIYYKFYYCANYGTPEYNSSPWIVMQDYSTSNTCSYTFSEANDYIVVVRAVTDPNNEPAVLPIYGQVVSVGNGIQVNIGNLSISETGTINASQNVTFTAIASSSAGDAIFYKFYYCANYGTPEYDASPWVVMQDYSTSNTCSYTFSEANDYIVVVRAVTDPNNEPASLPIIGGTITVSLDQEEIFTETVTAEEGAVIEASGFKLEILPGALLEDTEISAFSIPAQEEYSGEQLLGGIRFSPDGLELEKMALVEVPIELSADWSEDELIPIYEFAGDDPSFAAWNGLFAKVKMVDGQAVAFAPVLHFSGILLIRNCHSGTFEYVLDQFKSRGCEPDEAIKLVKDFENVTVDTETILDKDIQRFLGTFFEEKYTFGRGSEVSQTIITEMVKNIDQNRLVVLAFNSDPWPARGTDSLYPVIKHTAVLEKKNGKVQIRNSAKVSKNLMDTLGGSNLIYYDWDKINEFRELQTGVPVELALGLQPGQLTEVYPPLDGRNWFGVAADKLWENFWDTLLGLDHIQGIPPRTRPWTAVKIYVQKESLVSNPCGTDLNSSPCPMIYDLSLDNPNGVSDGVSSGYWINNNTQCTYEMSLRPFYLRSEIPYLEGKKHGLVKSYRYKSSSYIGTVQSTTNFDHGEADIRRYYDELGQQTSCRYIVNGKATNQVCP